MKRYWPIAVVLILLAGMFAFVLISKSKSQQAVGQLPFSIGTITPGRTCGRAPAFLHKMHIAQPVMIDLSQKRYKGIALLYGKGFSKSLHPRQWEQYGHFSTYALDDHGNIYLVPTPFISIHPTTFNLQKKLYRLDTHTGKVSIFMDFDDILPDENNPYGLNAVAYDCDDHTLWVAAIDGSDYATSRGVIYHINPKTKKTMQRVEGFDALTLKVAHTSKGKYLLAGSARDNGLYAYAITQGNMEAIPHKFLEIPDPNEHIRKIRIDGKDRLLLETIPFSYSLIARAAKTDRTRYRAVWSKDLNGWNVTKEDK